MESRYLLLEARYTFGMAQAYVVKSGDTLNKIAQSLGYANYKEAGISGFGDNPDKIQVGQTLQIAGGPKTSTLPGIGTITTTPKAINPQPPAATGGVGDNASGLYARTGVNPPPASGSTGDTSGTPSIAGLPSYGTPPATPQSAIMDAYKTTLDTITALESKISASAAPGPEEQALQKQLNDAKARLNSFDLGTLQAEEGLRGQGRGATLGTIDTRTTILDRTRALQRLGFAQEADTIATQLSTAQSNRQALGDVAKTEYDLATKKLDIALGVQDKIDSLNTKDQTEARQYLLDVVNFAQGKTYDQLDPATQQAITNAVANSPITLDMVKTALTRGASTGDLRSVSGVGVVSVKPDGTYTVVVPENPGDHTTPTTGGPSFNDYIAQQNIPLPALTQDKLTQLRAEYDAQYGGSSDVSLGKLNATNKNDLQQAGLSTAPTAVQSYFLNTPAAFRDQYQRDVASGKVSGTPSLASLTAAYTTWYNANKKGGDINSQIDSLFSGS